MLGKERQTPVGPTQTKEQAEREDRTVILAGLLHDIGSLAVPKNRYSVLAKISYVRWGFRNPTKDAMLSLFSISH
jgi:hypothetical protein